MWSIIQTIATVALVFVGVVTLFIVGVVLWVVGVSVIIMWHEAQGRKADAERMQYWIHASSRSIHALHLALHRRRFFVQQRINFMLTYPIRVFQKEINRFRK